MLATHLNSQPYAINGVHLHHVRSQGNIYQFQFILPIMYICSFHAIIPIISIDISLSHCIYFSRLYSYKYEMQKWTDETDDLENAIPSIIPNWDHTPRSGRGGKVYVGSTPELFEQQVRRVVTRIQHKPYDKRFIVMKSWNEWAEGNYVEPDLKYGHGYLDALKHVLLQDS